MVVLRYGSNSSVELEFAEGVVPDESGTPRGRPLADPTAALTAMLAAPFDYPSLADSTTPGDRVVVALDRDVPQVARVTAAIIHALVDAGVSPDGIVVLRSQPDREAARSDPCRMVASPLRECISVVTHDPNDRRQLAYLAATESGEAILISRALHEADLVLPVGCLRGDRSPGYFGIHGGIFPTFSDAKTIERFRGFGISNGRGNRPRSCTAEVDHVAWLLGINFTIQVIRAAGEQVLHVLAGESNAVRREGSALYQAAWSWSTSRHASLVVAAIEGEAGQQTWENVGRALEAARPFVEDGGSIALCCELAAPPGPAMQHLACAASREAALRQVRQHRPVDVLPAAQLVHALAHNKVYLLSRLAASVVEDLDMIPVADPHELARLVRRHPSCILLSNAPYVTAVEEHHGDADKVMNDE